MRKFLALLFALLLCTATKVYAEDTATVTVAVKDLPQKLQNRTVIVTLGNGPSDTESTVIVLDLYIHRCVQGHPETRFGEYSPCPFDEKWTG